ncbi:twin-arginine translocase subunit TatC [Halobaculum magnesiiphilum]|uniref:Sec-independent protein translocase protein TatC n=1 Tax=Halobaculum magnesiiphilum TaxID=1017351 RepID=A0A8T8W9C1_9EURY|nr:twin-arginine translocase subunit TatC [Halobaculum magnesiiphilum]QZP36353.1 twin-arginine translocase subunit TatC [Halobaculum magnesiiphilum]
MTGDSDPPEEPSAAPDGDGDAETAESTDPAESVEPSESAADEHEDGVDDDVDAGDDVRSDDDGERDDGTEASDDGETDDSTGSEDRPTDEESEIDRRSPFEDDDDADDDGDGDADADGDDPIDRGSSEPAPAAGEAPRIDESQPVPDAVAGERSGGGQSAANDGNGGGGTMTAAEKGMQAVNKGVGALGGGEGGGPDSDQEMPLAAHIEEMMRRLGIVFGIAGVVVVAVLLIGTVSPTVPSAEQIIEFLWDTHVGFEQNRPRVYGPLEFLLTKLKVASLAGLLVGLPVFVYETYRFMRPGLYPHERRYYLAAVPTSLILGIIGVAFTHFIVLPVIFDYFISYTEESAVLAFSLRETFNLILLMMGYMAVVFQIPLFIQLAIMMGLVTREWMEDRRLLFWSAFVGLAFIVSPDPTGMAPIIVGATMIALFEGTLALLRWTGN